MKYYSSKSAIRKAHHIDGRTLDNLLRRPDWPKFVKDNGWIMDGVDKIIIQVREQAIKGVKGPDADLKRQKMTVEIERIKADVRAREITERLLLMEEAKKKKSLIPVDQHRAIIQDLAGFIQMTFAQEISKAKVLTGDAKEVDRVEKQRDRILENMRGLIEQNTQRVKS